MTRVRKSPGPRLRAMEGRLDRVRLGLDTASVALTQAVTYSGDWGPPLLDAEQLEAARQVGTLLAVAKRLIEEV